MGMLDLLREALADMNATTSMVDVKNIAARLDANHGIKSGDSAGMNPALYEQDAELNARWLLGQLVQIAEAGADFAVNTWMNLAAAATA